MKLKTSTRIANSMSEENPKLIKHTLEFQPYELDYIKSALQNLRYSYLSKCPWVFLADKNMYYYDGSKDPNVKRLDFILKSIDRQLKVTQ